MPLGHVWICISNSADKNKMQTWVIWDFLKASWNSVNLVWAVAVFDQFLFFYPFQSRFLLAETFTWCREAFVQKVVFYTSFSWQPKWRESCSTVEMISLVHLSVFLPALCLCQKNIYILSAKLFFLSLLVQKCHYHFLNSTMAWSNFSWVHIYDS